MRELIKGRSNVGDCLTQRMRMPGGAPARLKRDSAQMAFIEGVDMAVVVEEKPTEEKKAKRKEAEANATKAESEMVTPEKEEPVAKQEKPEEAPVPAEEPQPKKRRWFGRKSEGEK